MSTPAPAATVAMSPRPFCSKANALATRPFSFAAVCASVRPIAQAWVLGQRGTWGAHLLPFLVERQIRNGQRCVCTEG